MISGQPSSGTWTAGDILTLIRDGKADNRSSISRLTGLARSTVSQRVETLTAAGLLIEAGDGPSSGGRPPATLIFDGSIGTVIGVDLGATQARLGVFDLSGRLLREHWEEISIAAGPEFVLSWVQSKLADMLRDCDIAPERVWSVGIGVPGPVDFEQGRAVAPPIMPGWDGVRIPDWFDSYENAKVLVDNDVHIMALGEYWTTWRGDIDNMLFVKVGSGIGAGIIAQGQVLRGSDGTAGDIGHIRLSDHVDTMCRCGNRGCLGALASGSALARQLTDLGLESRNTRDVVAHARAGNTSAVRLVRDAGRMVGEVLSGLVNFFNPAVIVVGGDMAAAEEQLFQGIREVVYERSMALATRSLRIVPSELGGNAGLVGASLLARETVLAAEAIDRRLNDVPPESGAPSMTAPRSATTAGG